MLSFAPEQSKRLRPLDNLGPDELQIHEIYASIQGESTYAGLPCVFVRTTACHLRCRWCDTPHAFMEGSRKKMAQVLDEVLANKLPMVEITGGEPLLQPAVFDFMRELCDRGKTVLLETSGGVDITQVDPRVVKIMDLKAPGSGEEHANVWENLNKLQPHDEIKIVLADRRDYEWSKNCLSQHAVLGKRTVLLSTVFGSLDPIDLAQWIVEDKLQVRMQLQLHKYIWPPEARGV